MRKWYVGSLFISLFLLTITGCKVVDNAVKGTLGKAKPTPTPPSQAPGGGGGGSTTFVLGQPDANTRIGHKLGLNYPESIVKVGTKFFVADFSNSRVLIYNSIPTGQTAPDVVVGQPDLASNTANNGGISNKSLNGPDGVASDGTRLFVADSGNHRVLIWNTIPTSHFQPADLVLGQPDFISNTANNGGISAQSMNAPYGIYVSSTRLFVAEQLNNRILIWNTIPTVNRQPADLELGQPDMTSNTCNNGGLNAQSICGAYRVASDGVHLLATDYNNNRVLIWNSFPTVNRQAADLVLGQPNMTSSAGGTTAQNMSWPLGVHSDGTHVFVNDYNNNRVLVWNTFPIANGVAADVVLGQPNMTTAVSDNTPGFPGTVSAQSIRKAEGGIFSDGTKLYMADARSRILIWNTIPTVNQQAADAVIGQPDFTQFAANNPGVSAQLMKQAWGINSDGTRLVVADSFNHRVLIWNSTPTTNQQPADVVIGQPNMTSNTANNGGINSQSLNLPLDATIVGGKLIVGDSSNSRVLIWNSIPTVNQQAADVVLGQPNMTSNTANNGGITNQSLNAARGVYSDGTRLFVADFSNHRVLIWNSIPTVNQQAADVVLGQPNMTSNTANNGGVSAQSMNSPLKMKTDSGRLFVSDWSNHRVLIWNTIPTVNQQAADVVLGQPNMTSNTANNGGISAQSFQSPGGVYIIGSRLYVPDCNNNRLLIWNSIPTVNQQAADLVFGQPDFTSNTANNGGLSGQRLTQPTSLYVNATQMFIAEFGNFRVLAAPVP